MEKRKNVTAMSSLLCHMEWTQQREKLVTASKCGTEVTEEIQKEAEMETELQHLEHQTGQ